jgi:hypothetical protein
LNLWNCGQNSARQPLLEIKIRNGYIQCLVGFVH